MNALRPYSPFSYLAVLLLLFSCNRAPKDDGKVPAPLFPQPQTIVANPDGGYAVNRVTGNSIQPLINSLGDTVLTGVPIPITPKIIHPDSVAKPKSFPVPPRSQLTQKIAHPNRHKTPNNRTVIPVNKDALTIIPIKHIADNDTTHFILNSTGQKVRTGVPIPVKGKVVKTTHPKPTKALPLAFKDAAITDIQYLDKDQGMNSSDVTAVLEDRNGNLWIGSWGGGVSKYDGATFEHFTENEGLSDNRVLSILEDRNGNLWFGTWGGGVSKYDGTTFEHYTENEGLTYNRVRSILEDRSGNLWFGTEGGGVSRLIPSGAEGYDGATFTHYTVKEGLIHDNVRYIAEDRNGNLWFGTTRGGVCRYDGNSFVHYTEKEGLSNNRVYSILEDRSGNLWFGTWGGGVSKLVMSGAEGYDGSTFEHYTEKEGLSNNKVVSIFEDNSGNLWFGTDGGGVNKLVMSGGAVNNSEAKIGTGEATFTHYTEKEGLSNNKVQSIIEDRSGNLWFGTFGGGVNRHDGATFAYFTEKEGLSNPTVLSMVEDRNGTLWFGTWGGGISRYDGTTFTHYSEKEGLNNSTVLSMIEDRNGNLWFGTLGGGVSRFDGKTFTHYTKTEGLSNNSVFSMLEDRNGNLWFGTFGEGVSRFDGKIFTHYTENEGLSNYSVLAMLEDRNGNLWFGTNGGGVSRLIPSGGEGSDGAIIEHFTEKEGLSNNVVWSILEDRNGNLWFGTNGGGVSLYDGKTFTHFTEKEGLSNNVIQSFIEDKRGNVFSATSNGLTTLSDVGGDSEKNTLSINILTKPDGLKSLFFELNSALIDSKNRAWWGNRTSLAVMDLNKFNTSTKIPQPHLKQLGINEKFIDYRTIPDSLGKGITFNGVQQFENYPLNVELPYDKNHLTFHFAAIDWAAPHKLKYSYRMLGLNANWSSPTSKTETDYRNLPHGTYTFQISAIGESGQWSAPFEYTFTINPPWWFTWWAFTLYALIFFAALRQFSLWREQRLQEEKQQLQQKVEERTLQLAEKNDSLKMANEEIQQQRDDVVQARDSLEKTLENLKNTQNQLIQQEKLASLGQLTSGIAHEIKNPLNFVNNFSELSMELIDEALVELGHIEDNEHSKETTYILEDIKSNLSKIHNHGTRANAIVTSMLQHSRASNGQKEPADFNSLVKEFVNLSFHGMRAGKHPINVDIHYDLDESVGQVSIISEDFSRVILNLCNNGFDAMRDKLSAPDKESSNPYKAILTIRTKRDHNTIILEIEDNGSGIPDEIKEKILQPFFTTKKGTEGTGLGLSISNDIIKAHGGELVVATSKNEKTMFSIRIPQ